MLVNLSLQTLAGLQNCVEVAMHTARMIQVNGNRSLYPNVTVELKTLSEYSDMLLEFIESAGN